MKLDCLTVAGFTRFRDPVTLDLRDVPAGSLVAITGANGEGKTTLLDSVLAPLFLTMPSRRGTLATYATSSSSFLEALYSLENGWNVRAYVPVDGPRRTTKPVLQIDQPGAMRYVTPAGVKAYQADVARLFPPLELALASAFAPQNRAGSFVTATPAERKELFSTCLGLEQFAAWAETAKAAAVLCERTIATLEGRRQVLAGLTALDVVERLETDLVRAKERELEREEALQMLQGSRASEERRRVELEADLEVYRRAQQAHEAALLTATHVYAEGVTLLRERDKRLEEALQARRRVTLTRDEELEEVRQAWAEVENVRDVGALALEKRIAANQALAGQAVQVRTAAAAKAQAETEVERILVVTTGLQGELDDQILALEVDQRNLAPVERSRELLEEAQRQVAVVERVPCEGRLLLVLEPDGTRQNVDGAACQFLKDAAAAGATIAELEERVLLLPTALRAVETRRAVIAGLRQSLGTAKREVELHRGIIRETTAAAALEPELARVEERVAAYRREIDALLERAGERLVDLERRRNRAGQVYVEALAELEALQEPIAADLRARDEALAERRAGVDEIIRTAAGEVERHAGAAGKMDRTVEALKQIGDQIARITGELAGARAQVEQIGQEVKTIALYGRELDQVEVSLEGAQEERLVWETLVRCFGRDGLPTLEIANAGPTVSSLTNELLEVAYGTRFTVEVVTQVERADKKGLREDFTIRIFDNQEGGVVRDIADLSGGERVLVEEALRAAIMIFVNARNVTPIRTICRDETTGALDPENAVRYVAMLRRLVTLSGAAHCLFITHNPECSALADVVVEVKDGRLERRPAA